VCEVDGRKIAFEIIAIINGKQTATTHHARVVVDRHDFLEKVRSASHRPAP